MVTETEDGRWRERGEAGRGGTCAGNGQSEKEKEEENDGVMTELPAKCLYMNLQAN